MLGGQELLFKSALPLLAFIEEFLLELVDLPHHLGLAVLDRLGLGTDGLDCQRGAAFQDLGLLFVCALDFREAVPGDLLDLLDLPLGCLADTVDGFEHAPELVLEYHRQFAELAGVHAGGHQVFLEAEPVEVVHSAQHRQGLLVVELLGQGSHGFENAVDAAEQLLPGCEWQGLQFVLAEHTLERQQEPLQPAQRQIDVADLRRRVLGKHAGYLPHAGLEHFSQLRNLHLHFHRYISLSDQPRRTGRARGHPCHGYITPKTPQAGRPIAQGHAPPAGIAETVVL